MDIDTLRLLYSKQKEKALQDWITLLEFPSISSDSSQKETLRNCAKWLLHFLDQMGFNGEIWETEGHPTVFAKYLEAGPTQPTLLIYNHYDVQPVDPLDKWSSPPFKPTVRDGELYARGAQDNKGQLFYTLQALKALLKSEGHLPINVKLCIEGEEEIGSPGLTKILSQRSEDLKADLVAIIDNCIPAPMTPALTLGVRGIVTFDVEVKGPNFDLHSGSQGGIVANPATVLARLIASLHDSNGKVTIPGFYDHVTKLSDEERALLSFDFDEQKFEKMFGVKAQGGESHFLPLERCWTRPTLEVNGFHSGYGGEGFKTIIPSRAQAKISCRLVPGQTPKKIEATLKEFLEHSAPPGVQVTVIPHAGGGVAARANPNSPFVRAFASAYTQVFNKQCEYVLEGGSIPIASNLVEASGGELILLGLGLADDHIHAPNEHFGLDRFEQGFLVVGSALYELSKVGLYNKLT